MRRREFVTLVGGAAVWPLAARAQQPANMRTVGYLGPTTPERLTEKGRKAEKSDKSG